MKRLIIFILPLLFIGIVSAVQICEVYDDFGSGILNLSKWNEYSNIGFTDEHFVNTSEKIYHIKQNIQGDKETNLEPNRQFVAGESFSYEVLYESGNGNHFSQPLINGNYPPTQIEPCLAPGGCGPIGFWNGVPDLGAQIGTYSINFEFLHNEVKMTAIRPDNVAIINTFTGNSEPYTLTINTHTGHNGLMHFDYDNFEICSEQEEPTLEERMTRLEQKVEELENKTSWLESLIVKIVNFIKNLPNGLSKNWNY